MPEDVDMSAFIQINVQSITHLTVRISWAVFMAQTHLTVQFKWHLGEKKSFSDTPVAECTCQEYNQIEI